jgi:hypothetical protein
MARGVAKDEDVLGDTMLAWRSTRPRVGAAYVVSSRVSAPTCSDLDPRRGSSQLRHLLLAHGRARQNKRKGASDEKSAMAIAGAGVWLAKIVR